MEIPAPRLGSPGLVRISLPLASKPRPSARQTSGQFTGYWRTRTTMMWCQK